MVQSKHFLVETEDGSAEKFDDYADGNLLTETGPSEYIYLS